MHFQLSSFAITLDYGDKKCQPFQAVSCFVKTHFFFGTLNISNLLTTFFLLTSLTHSDKLRSSWAAAPFFFASLLRSNRWPCSILRQLGLSSSSQRLDCCSRTMNTGPLRPMCSWSWCVVVGDSLLAGIFEG